MKRRYTLLVFILLLGIMTIFFPLSDVSGVYASDDLGLDTSKSGDNMANIVIFVNFSDTTHTHIESYWGQCFEEDPNLANLFYDDNKTRSLRSYIKKISYGNILVGNIFPQYNPSTEKIVPITLDQTAVYYGSNFPASADILVNDVSQKLIEGDYIKPSMVVDKDGDGNVDNLTIVVPCESGNSNTMFCGLASSFSGSKQLNGKYVASYNIITESGAYLSNGQSGLICHEFMHRLGFPDLYRNGKTPVGTWDIMSSESMYLQYPLAYTRASFGGWFDIPTVTSDNANYSLYSAEAATTDAALKNNQAVILKTPYSDTEFFVLEYRKKTSSYDSSEPLECGLYGSGLIIYRVNVTGNKTNAGTDPFYIYVFRPEDTMDGSVEAAGTSIYDSYLSAESGRTSFGSSDLTKGLSDHAITYSDGFNSGIVIENVGSASGDAISFDIKFTDLGSDYWSTVANQNYEDHIFEESACVDGNGDGYIAEAFYSQHKIKVYKVSNGVISASPVMVIDDYSIGCKLVSVGNDLYLGYVSSSGKFKLCKYSGGEQSFVYTSSVNAGNSLSMATGSDGIYVTFTSEDNNTVYVGKCNGTTYTSLGNKTVSYAANLDITVVGNVPYVAYREFFNNNTVSVYMVGENTWTSLGLTGVKSGILDIESDGTDIFLVTGKQFDADTYNKVYVYRDHSWNEWTSGEYTAGQITTSKLMTKEGRLYLLYQDSEGLKAVTWTDSGWKDLGNKITAQTVSGFDGYFIGNSLFASFHNNDGMTLCLRKYDVSASTTPGEDDPPVHEHRYGTPVFHWTTEDGMITASAKFTCLEDGSHTKVINASISSTVKSAATCRSKGTHTYVATVSMNGNTYSDSKDYEDIEINPSNHVGGTMIVGAIAATESEEGYTGDTCCKSCGKVLKKGEVIPRVEGTKPTPTPTPDPEKPDPSPQEPQNPDETPEIPEKSPDNSEQTTATPEISEGWQQDFHGWWYRESDGSYPVSEWKKTDGTWYYFDGSGYMATGWIYDGGSWYYLNSSGAMATGWVYDGGSWYYLNSSGAMATGWVLDGGNWYYMYASGAMAYDTVIGGYRLGKNGAMSP